MNAKHEPSVEKKALVDTLLAIDSRMPTSSAEGRKVAKEVLRRDRRRVRILTWVTTGLLLLTFIGICGGISWFYIKITSWMIWYQQVRLELGQQFSNQDPLGSFALVTGQACHVLYMSQLATLGGIVALLVFMLAAIASTILLIRATRGATLRQIQASLLALSEQFDSLQQSLQDGQRGGQATKESSG